MQSLIPRAPALRGLRSTGRHVAVCAKKGKGSSQGKSAIADLLKKKKDEEAAQVASPDEYRDPEVRALLLYTVDSYYRATKQPLIEADFDVLPDALFNAPFALLIHNRFQEGVKDPLFIYGNRAALTLFEASWGELVGTPSRKSAADEQTTQEERQRLLDAAAASPVGAVFNYEGWRVSFKGTKFQLKGVTLFNVLDPDGDKIGQAAVFDRYVTEGGKEVSIEGYTPAGADAAAAAAPLLPPSQEEIDAAEAAVKQWGDYVRTLKEQQGLTNKDPAVMEAVGNLTAWKAQLASLQQRLEAELAAAKAAFDDEDDEE